MSQRCHLTIYEPEKNPRVVELSTTEGNDLFVYNEDGSVLEDYQLYLETPNDQFVKVPSPKGKLKGKWNALKFWKNLINTERPPTQSIVSDVPVSESAQNFLKTYMINSSKKEKKIARLKVAQNAITDKKLRNKLKKQRRKEMKRFFSQQCFSESLLNASGDPFTELSSSGDNGTKKINWKQGGKLCVPNVEKCAQAIVENVSSSKKRNRRKQKKVMNLQKQNETNESTPKDTPSSESNRTKMSAAEPCSSSDQTTINPSTSSRTHESDMSTTTTRWKASEPALDFIPITRSQENETHKDSPNFPKNSNDRLYSKFLSHINSRSRKNEYLGLSQKAFFLQC